VKRLGPANDAAKAALDPGPEGVLALASGTPHTTFAPGTSIHQRSSDQTFEGAAAIAAE